MKMHTCLTVAGSDCSGGAGIQADLKTFSALQVYGMSVITALTAQNTTGVTAVVGIEPDFFLAQLKAVFEDIPPDAVKVGMIASPQLIHLLADFLKGYDGALVVDPVMVATSGADLSSTDSVVALKERLLPIAQVITPNLFEAEVLTEQPIKSKEDMERAAQTMQNRWGCSVLLKGGHIADDADDILVTPTKKRWYKAKRINNSNTHGTGCTLSSAIAAGLAVGYSLEEAVQRGKDYVTGAIAAGLDLGKGRGPLDHGWSRKG